MEEYTAGEEEVQLKPHTETTPVAEPEVQKEAKNPTQKEKWQKRIEKSRVEEAKEAKDIEAFISNEAYSFWGKNLSDKGFIGERGFGTFTSPFVEIIEKMCWSLLFKHKPPGFAAVVRKFYSNMIDMKEDSVYVRGV